MFKQVYAEAITIIKICTFKHGPFFFSVGGGGGGVGNISRYSIVHVHVHVQLLAGSPDLCQMYRETE